MENITKNHISTSDVNYELIRSTISNIDKFVSENGYQYKNRIGLDEITEASFNLAYNQIKMESYRKQKRFAKYIWRVNNHPTLGGVNKFLHFFMKNIMKSESRVKIILSDKEIAIQEKRKAYKEARAKMEAAFSDYKTEKGDFYKLKLNKKSIS